MNYKNFLMLCISLISVSDLHSMQLVTKRVPRSVYRINSTSPVMQKREIDYGEILVVALAKTGATLLTIGGCLGGCLVGIHIIGRYKKKQEGIARMHECRKRKEEAYEYVDQGNVEMYDVKFLENIDHNRQSRFACLQELEKRYNQCCFVENEEIDKFWAESEKNSIDLEKYRSTFNRIIHKKESLYSAIMLIQQDMPYYQQKAEELHAKRLQLTSISDDLKNNVIKREKINEMNGIIKKITHKHACPQKKVPEFKLLRDAEKQQQAGIKE